MIPFCASQQSPRRYRLHLRVLQIAGTALNGIIKKGEREECERRLAELQDDKFKSIFGLLYRVNEQVDLFAKYGVDELFECRILSVDEAYRGRGLANLLVENSLSIARNSGFKVGVLATVDVVF